MEQERPDNGAGAPSRRNARPIRPEGGPSPQRTSLVRALGPIDATLIVIGSMIGSGIFITSAESSRLSGAPGWLVVGKIMQNTFTFASAAALAAVVVIGLSLGWNANSAALSSAWWDSWANGWDPQIAQPGLKVVGGLALALVFGRSMVGPLFAQTAWTNVTFVGSEVREPGKNLVRALVGGCGIVVVLYLLA